MYRLRRIPRSVSLFLSFTVDGEGSMLHLLYRSCLSLPLASSSIQLKPSSRIYAPYYLVARSLSVPRLGNRFLRCANRRWLKIKAPRFLSLSLLRSPRRSVFCPPRTCLSPWRRIFRRLLSHERCTRARTDRIRRAFDYERSNRARVDQQSHSPPVIAIYRRIKMAYEENCFLNKLQAFHSGIPDASTGCPRVCTECYSRVCVSC